jgi:hypothetical protein
MARHMGSVKDFIAEVTYSKSDHAGMGWAWPRRARTPGSWPKIAIRSSIDRVRRAIFKKTFR